MLPPRRCENFPTALEGRPGIELVVVGTSEVTAAGFLNLVGVLTLETVAYPLLLTRAITEI